MGSGTPSHVAARRLYARHAEQCSLHASQPANAEQPPMEEAYEPLNFDWSCPGEAQGFAATAYGLKVRKSSMWLQQPVGRPVHTLLAVPVRHAHTAGRLAADLYFVLVMAQAGPGSPGEAVLPRTTPCSMLTLGTWRTRLTSAMCSLTLLRWARAVWVGFTGKACWHHTSAFPLRQLVLTALESILPSTPQHPTLHPAVPGLGGVGKRAQWSYSSCTADAGQGSCHS